MKSILISAAVRLNPFSIPAIQNLTDDDNVELEKVGDELTCFFAIIPQTNSTFNFLISMLFSQMFESLYYKGATIPNSRLPYHVRFLLDEFANIGKIPEFPQKISTCRKYNISTTIVLQSIAQIKMLYKDDYETIIGNCDTAICLGTNEQTTADYFSKKLGKGTITSRSKSTPVGKSGGNLSFNQTGRELMLPDEIMTMPFDKCIVMMRGIDPFYDSKYPLEKHPQFMKTGDGDEKNFYFLEQDEEFSCVDKSVEYEEIAEQEENNDTVSEKYQPKTLEEVLDGILVNYPEEDGYYLIKDADNNKTRNSMITKYSELLEDTIQMSMGNDETTILFDGKNMDIALAKGLINRAFEQHDGEFEDLAVACNGISDGHVCWFGAKNDQCNIVKVAERLQLSISKKKRGNISRHDLYKVNDILSEDKFEELKKGCKNGAHCMASQKNNDVDFDDYDD